MRRMSLLRSWEELPVEFYKHHAPTELRAERLAFRVCQQYQSLRRSIRWRAPDKRLKSNKIGVNPFCISVLSIRTSI
jgi:hypothetical protein